MKVLVLNCGSSSIKFQLFASATWTAIAAGAVSQIGEAQGAVTLTWRGAQGQEQAAREALVIATHRAGIDLIIARLGTAGVLADVAELAAIGHRVVHGGEHFQCPTVVDDTVAGVIRDQSPLAPLHNPANLDGIEVARQCFPGVPSVAVFDTAFHQTMPPIAYRYAIPEYLYRTHRVRRYGFHGTSHHYVGERAAEFLGQPFDQCNLITLHLGNGASATAIRAGRSIDTSMGMTPLEGLVMGTRCGDIDPAIVFYAAQHLGLTTQALDDLLNRDSGLLGLCGVNDMREIERRAADGDAAAALAIGITTHRLKKYIGAYYAELGRVDAIVFTGGIGENDAEVRAGACGGLERLGIELDAAANRSADRGERAISTTTSPVQVLVIPTNEELQIAREALEAVN
ncbi:MAG TPA: acetate kinase [Lamprocystis sp. (in: g-proteobacteria)]|nr:acetate kinase [Lamprocystis sp. (in: g-proteobacteria)]